MKGNPYVGPRPYERRDRHSFFGRSREARELRSLILAERAVLFYAQSGAGKTSLLNAKVIPALEEEGFDVLPVARVGSDMPPAIDPREVDNIFVLSALMALAGQETPPERLLHHTLRSFMGTLWSEEQGGNLKQRPPLLIFDQFEELFTTHRARWQDAQGFFVQMREALDALPSLGVTFAMREDHVAKLDPHLPLLPHRLRARFRMERLRKRAALAAVTGPLSDTKRSFAEGAAEQLVAELLEVRIETVAGETEVVTGEFVEPVQLQVVCQTLWRDLPSDVTVITQDHLQTFGDVDRALSRFYERSIKAAAQEPGVKENTLRTWFDDKLITSAGTRGMVYRGPEEAGGMPNAAVDVLENLHLIRGERRAGARWYELTHDRFIEPIQESNRTWREKRKRPLFAALAAVVTGLVVIVGLAFAATWSAGQRAEATAEAALATGTAQAALATAIVEANERVMSQAQMATATVSAAEFSTLRSRVRPLRPGLSVSVEDTTAGTIGAFVRDARGEVYLITEASILGMPDCDLDSPVLQPGRYDDGTLDDLIGYVAQCLLLNDEISAANLVGLARLEQDITFETAIPGIGSIRGIRQPISGMFVRKVGRTTGLTTGEIIEVGLTQRITFGQRTFQIVDCVLATGMSRGGDGGALVVDDEGYAVGVVVAGSQVTTILAPIQDVLDALEVQLLGIAP